MYESNFIMPEINHLLLQLNYLILYNNKNTFGAFVSYCLEHHQMLNVIELIFPYHMLNEECKGKDFEVSFYYIKMMIELYKNKTNFILIINNEHFHFIFSEKQYDRVFPMLRLNEEKFKDSILKVYKSIKGKKELKTINLLTKDEYVNKTKTFFKVAY